ncbi:MAG: GNAT family N-acetyltransferase [Flavobacteriales bacterium]
MLHTSFDPFPELHTECMHLVAFHPQYVEALHALRSHPDVTHYLQRPVPASMDETMANIEINRDLVSKGEGIAWVMLLKDTGAVVGVVGFWRMKKEHYRAEVGYLMFPEYWGKGMMSEALQAALRFAFEQMHAHSIDADIHPANGASAKILERNGFVREAYLRENFYFNGEFHDSVWYGLLKRDWEAAQKKSS